MGEPGRCDAGNTAGDVTVDLGGLVGRRVVVRHRVGDKLTDAVGELSIDGSELLVHTRRGPVRVARTAVTAVRAIPPPPPRRASLSAIARLEALCADAWPALVEDRLGAWRLRAAGGFTGRANGALAIGDPGMPTAAALDVVRAFADRNGIAPRVQVPVGSSWDRAVAAQGWVLDVGHAAGALVSVQVVDLARVADGPQPGSGATDARRAIDSPGKAGTPTDDPESDGRRQEEGAPTDDRRTAGSTVEAGAPTDAWWRLVVDGAPTPAQRHVLAGVPGCFPVRHEGGVAVAACRAVIVEDHLHLSMLTVAPSALRRGHGSAVLAAAAAWGRERGARWGVLQVAVPNTAALALYARSGWTEHHRYRYLVPGGG